MIEHGELRACDVCGSIFLVLLASPAYCVRCIQCGATSSNRTTRADAICDWNRHTGLSERAYFIHEDRVLASFPRNGS